ncbi:hypothetical protein B0H66DRAFT_628578 [Apodospora peruviana]|uniref:Fe2OG dioxygenase domain-containing protein n=1 Tax=Apodospora peruviana TaxID=516989 RepID=A0AAE0HYX5_9PEZI|nr:hypothetical protein B0H66DRAFT_628578 [Apodospora peruviana]
MTSPLQILTLSLTVALSAYFGPIILSLLAPHIQSLLPSSGDGYQCPPHSYTTTIISLDPLLIYIHNFVSSIESSSLVTLGTPLLEPSPVTGYGSDAKGSQARTSWSAPLPSDNEFVSCILARAESFMGNLLLAGRDEIGQAQLVRYTEGQKFDLHHDWFSRPRLLDDDAETGRRRLYNRVATIFLTLEAKNVTEGTGETWFPFAKRVWADGTKKGAGGEEADEKEKYWREHEDGGLAFKAIPGNALFWVNLFPGNGSGDGRTLHAGLPVKGNGVKTAMNIWPRVFFGPDA